MEPQSPLKRRIRTRRGQAAPRPSASSAPPDGTLRTSILEAAVSSLVERGVARTTTLEVQRRAGVSRGALLHHFPTHALLLSATIDELVRQNEATVREVAAALEGVDDGCEQAIRALAFMTVQPPFLAELELWATARVDAELRVALVAAERRARQHSDRVVRALFAPVSDRPGYEAVVVLTVEMMRGLAVSSVLRRSSAHRKALVSQWVQAARILLEHWR